MNYFHVVLADEMREVEFSTIVATKGKQRAAINQAAKEGSKKFPFMEIGDWYCLYVKQVNGPLVTSDKKERNGKNETY